MEDIHWSPSKWRVTVGTCNSRVNSSGVGQLRAGLECSLRSGTDPAPFNSLVQAGFSELSQMSRQPFYGCPKELSRRGNGLSLQLTKNLKRSGLRGSRGTPTRTQGRLLILSIAGLENSESRAVLGASYYESGLRRKQPLDDLLGPGLPGDRKATTWHRVSCDYGAI